MITALDALEIGILAKIRPCNCRLDLIRPLQHGPHARIRLEISRCFRAYALGDDRESRALNKSTNILRRDGHLARGHPFA